MSRLVQKLIILSLCLSFHAEAQTIFQTLEKSTNLSQESYPKLLEKFSNKNFELSAIKDVNQVIFHPAFMNILMLYNKGNVLNLGLRDKCSLIDLVSTDLLYSPTGKLKNVLIKFKNKKDKLETHVLPKNQFLKLIGYKQCPKSETLKKYFSPRNLRATLKTEKIQIPNSAEQCKEFRTNFLNNVKAPYLCDIANKIKNLPIRKVQLKNLNKANYRKYQTLKKQVETSISYSKILNKDSLLYLDKFCEHSTYTDQFCEDIFKINYWTNSLKAIKDETALKFYCSFVYPNKKLTENRLNRCAQSLTENPRICQFLGEGKSSLYPKPFCKELSVSLNNSRLYQTYNDCPAKVGSDSLVTASRIINHLNSKSPILEDKNCEANSTYPFAEFNQEFLEFLFWQVQVCYDDKIKRKRVCYPTILSNVKNSELSLSKTIGNILKRLKGFKNDESNQCQIIQASNYRPSLLKYKTGCFILKEEKNCYGTTCNFRVIYDDLEFKKFEFESKLSFDLLPFRYTEENRSFIKLIERYKKVRLKDIINISSFRRIFNEYPKAIYMGVGCAEDLLPSYFKSKSINQCNILPFIVDGILEDNGRYSLVTRTSFDQIHSPRLIPWTYIFSSIKNYQTHHPLNQWSFYAIY